MQFFHHLDITVSDVARSKPVFRALLEHAGLTLKSEGDDWAGWGAPGKRYACITIIKSAGPNAQRAHDRYSSGLHHLALRAASREDVDALHAELLALGVTILDAPSEYPDYGTGYYAVFFSDPDGIKLEYVFTPPEAEARV